ncbi:MAG: hypothetical protein M3Y72_02000 [Acidobacteriota bacterium]|nr:hypothetical protein [Acidobacteriota bacterium]
MNWALEFCGRMGRFFTPERTVVAPAIRQSTIPFTGEWAAGPDFPDGLDIADGPTGQEDGLSELVVVANGIPSNPVVVYVQ